MLEGREGLLLDSEAGEEDAVEQVLGRDAVELGDADGEVDHVRESLLKGVEPGEKQKERSDIVIGSSVDEIVILHLQDPSFHILQLGSREGLPAILNQLIRR